MQTLLLPPLILLIAVAKWTEGSPCDYGWFGAKCQDKCHCTENKCDDEGECTGGARCEKGWFGPACQYIDLVTTDSMEDTPLWFRDGDDSTCNDDPSLESIRVHFDKPTYFTWLRLHVKDPALFGSTHFQFIFNLKFEWYTGRYSVWPVVSTVDTNTVDVRQYYPTSGFFEAMLISGVGVKSLCSVYLSGGRNVALRYLKTEQSSIRDQLSAPSHAVDGSSDYNYTHGSCTETALGYSQSWRIVFQSPVTVYSYELIPRKDRGLGYLKIMFYNHAENTKVQKANATEPGEIYFSILHEWQTRRMSPITSLVVQSDEMENETLVSLCEVVLYGDTVCPAGSYGRECEERCHCAVENEQCFASTGGCPSGCAAGYQGMDCQSLTFCTGADTVKIGGRCVRLVKERASWKEAKAACEALGPSVTLADLTFTAVREYIQNMTKVSSDISYQFWLGGTDVQKEGHWMWSYSDSKTDAMIPDSWWKSGQPDNYYGNEDCLTIRYDGLLNDYRCYEKLPYFCLSGA